MEQTAVHGSLLDESCSVYEEEAVELSGGVFDALWPDLARAVVRSLLRRGVDRSTAEDIAQEVALRSLGKQFASIAHARRWCTRVAVNLSIDGVRRSAPDRPRRHP